MKVEWGSLNRRAGNDADALAQIHQPYGNVHLTTLPSFTRSSTRQSTGLPSFLLPQYSKSRNSLIEVPHQERVGFKKSAVMASHADSAHDLLDLDISTLRQYVELFPTEGLAKVITGYLSSGISKYPLTQEKEKDAPDLSEGGVSLSVDVPVSQDDCLALMTVSSFSDSIIGSGSVMIHRGFGYIYTCCTNHDLRKAFWKPGNHHLPMSY